MSFDPFEEEHPKAILEKACKGRKGTLFHKTFQSVLKAKMKAPSYHTGGVSIQLGQECLALAEIVSAARGNGKIELPVIAEDWLNTGIEFDDAISELAKAAVDKVRTRSASWAIVQDMGGWPAWTGYCRGLSTRLGKQSKKRKAVKKAEGLDAVIRRLKAKQCRIEMEGGDAVELRCVDKGKLTDDDLADVVQLKKLRLLFLASQPITDAGLGQLSELRQLRELSLDRCNIRGKGLRDLELPRLREFTYGREGTNAVLANCQHLTGLRSITLRCSDVTDAGLRKLAFATSLESLNIDQCKAIKGSGLKVLSNFPRLRELTAMLVQISPAGFESICQSAKLRQLNLMAAKLPVRKLSQLSGLRKLEELNLFGIDGLADEHLTFLKGMKKLRKLELDRNSGITDETVKLLSTHPNIEDLSLWECSITQETADLFLSMKKLRELSVAQTGYSRAAEKRLMKALERR